MNSTNKLLLAGLLSLISLTASAQFFFFAADTTGKETIIPCGSASLTLAEPTQGQSVTQNTADTLKATVTASSPIDSVVFYLADTVVGSVLSAPYKLAYSTGATAVDLEYKVIVYDSCETGLKDSLTFSIVAPPTPPASDNVLDSVATIMDFTWSGDSLEVDTSRYESDIGSEISTIYDYSDNFDWPWSGDNVTLAYRTDLYSQALPNAHEGVDRFGNGYVRFHNANGVTFSGNSPGGAPGMSNTNFSAGTADTLSGFTVLYLNQNLYSSETFGGNPFKIRERTSPDALEIAGTGAEWSGGSGVIPRAQLCILEFQQDRFGRTRMWVNGEPWDNGNFAYYIDNGDTIGPNQTINSGGFIGYQTGAHGASHLMYLHTIKIGALTSSERTKMYNWLESKYYTDSVIFPNIQAVNGLGNEITYIEGEEAYYMPVTDSFLIDDTPIVNIEWKWALHYWENNTGAANLNTQKFLETIPEANNDTLFRNDFSGDENWSKLTGGATNTGMGPTDRKITVFYRVTDAEGRKSPWLMGPRRDDDQE